MSPRPLLLLALHLSLATSLAPAAREARIVELLGKGRVGLPQSDEVELDELVANLEGQKPTIASVRGDWDLLYTSKSEFDPANPLGRRVAVPKSNVSLASTDSLVDVRAGGWTAPHQESRRSSTWPSRRPRPSRRRRRSSAS